MESFKDCFIHLKKDPVMETLIEKLGESITLEDRYEDDLAKAISQLVIEQQVSFKAAITIKKRFHKIIKNLSYAEIIKIETEKLKSKVVKELTSIKGIGIWTAEMFLIFILFKKNIFSKGDLALINSIKINYQINELSEIKLDEIVSKWSPFKTIASLLLWKSIEEKIYSID